MLGKYKNAKILFFTCSLKAWSHFKIGHYLKIGPILHVSDFSAYRDRVLHHWTLETTRNSNTDLKPIQVHISYLCSNANSAFIQNTNSQLISFTKFSKNVTFWNLKQQNKDWWKMALQLSVQTALNIDKSVTATHLHSNCQAYSVKTCI